MIPPKEINVEKTETIAASNKSGKEDKEGKDSLFVAAEDDGDEPSSFVLIHRTE
jgi:hypothetical protein